MYYIYSVISGIISRVCIRIIFVKQDKSITLCRTLHPSGPNILQKWWITFLHHENILPTLLKWQFSKGQNSVSNFNGFRHLKNCCIHWISNIHTKYWSNVFATLWANWDIILHILHICNTYVVHFVLYKLRYHNNIVLSNSIFKCSCLIIIWYITCEHYGQFGNVNFMYRSMNTKDIWATVQNDTWVFFIINTHTVTTMRSLYMPCGPFTKYM